MQFTRSDKTALNRNNNRPMPMLSEQEKEKREAFMKKEQVKIGSYWDIRDKRFNNQHKMGDPLSNTGIRCQESNFANKNSHIER